eukprot:TRINITY_DN6569_c0_g1_i1.p1 TRINITY_DN6569_c0_g1~~TRINITY_DN6569_c0_g1_i1.p1  ORF type:complete len:129 (+),score=18.52 TRINITY_DN6569_c0_g1_i1:96-482(+)
MSFLSNLPTRNPANFQKINKADSSNHTVQQPKRFLDVREGADTYEVIKSSELNVLLLAIYKNPVVSSMRDLQASSLSSVPESCRKRPLSLADSENDAAIPDAGFLGYSAKRSYTQQPEPSRSSDEEMS